MAAKTLFAGGATGKLYLDRRQFYLDAQSVAELWPSVTPFTTIIEQLPIKSNLSDPLFKLFEHRAPWVKQQFQVTSTESFGSSDTETNAVTIKNGTTVGLAGAVTANTADSSYLGLIVEVWDTTKTTKKAVLVITSVASATTVKFKTLATFNSATAFANDDYCHVVGNVAAEGATAREAWADELSVVFNSTQRMEVPVEVTGTLYKAALRGYSNELARLREDKIKEFQFQREQNFLRGASALGTGMSGGSFGDTYVTSDGSKAMRTTMGIIPAIETYGSTSGDSQNKFTIVEGTYNYANFVDDMEKVFQYSDDGGQKFAFCGPGAISYWSKIAERGFPGVTNQEKVTLSPFKQNALGFNVRMLETPHGILHLVPTKAMKQFYNKSMMVLHTPNVFKAVYSAMEYKNNIKTDNNYHGVKDVVEEDSGIGIGVIESHQLFNIQ